MTPWGLVARLRAGHPSIAYSPIAMGCGPWAPGLTAARVLLVLLAEACVAPPLPDYHCGLCDRLDGLQDGGSLPMPLNEINHLVCGGVIPLYTLCEQNYLVVKTYNLTTTNTF